MIKRTIYISNPADLFLELERIVILQKDEVVERILIRDVGLLCLVEPQITLSHALISALLENNVAVIVSDKKRMPSGLLLAISGSNLHNKTLKEQVEMTASKKKGLWQEIIRAKITNQARALDFIHGDDSGLFALAERVQSGDKGNREATAAFLYWRKLFGNEFRRDTTKEGINALLNYGYAIVRAAVARSLVGTGLHPALGIFHHNQYNSFALVDDVMEPARPFVDAIVYNIHLKMKDQTGVNRETKRELIAILGHSFRLGNKHLQLFAALQYYAASFRKAMTSKSNKLSIPTFDFPIKRKLTVKKRNRKP